MKKILINLKDWLNLKENIEFSQKIENLDIVVFPSLPYLYLYKDKNYDLGIQDIPNYPKGPHTGSTSLENLKDFNISYCIINHRENKIQNLHLFKEKIQNAIENRLKIIICIDKYDEHMLTAIKSILDDSPNASIFLAYEPIESTKYYMIEENLRQFRRYFANYSINYIYGGNISLENIHLYNKLNIDGLLISSHALNTDELNEIYQICQNNNI